LTLVAGDPVSLSVAVVDAGWAPAAAVELPLTGELWPQAARMDAVMSNAAHRAKVATCLISSMSHYNMRIGNAQLSLIGDVPYLRTAHPVTSGLSAAREQYSRLAFPRHFFLPRLTEINDIRNEARLCRRPDADRRRGHLATRWQSCKTE
jgi:hypothetical protein